MGERSGRVGTNDEVRAVGVEAEISVLAPAILKLGLCSSFPIDASYSKAFNRKVDQIF